MSSRCWTWPCTGTSTRCMGWTIFTTPPATAVMRAGRWTISSRRFGAHGVSGAGGSAHEEKQVVTPGEDKVYRSFDDEAEAILRAEYAQVGRAIGCVGSAPPERKSVHYAYDGIDSDDEEAEEEFDHDCAYELAGEYGGDGMRQGEGAWDGWWDDGMDGGMDGDPG